MNTTGFICFGELLSTTIIASYLEKQGRKAKFTDIRKCLITDQNYRNACVDIELSAQLCRKTFNFQDTFMYITQGFIAGTTTNQTTTLGREGSDYTAALFGQFAGCRRCYHLERRARYYECRSQNI